MGMSRAGISRLTLKEEDFGSKRDTYAWMGVREYYEQDRLRLYDPKTYQCLLTHEESEVARHAAEAKAAQEQAARQAAETELIRLCEELAKLREQK